MTATTMELSDRVRQFDEVVGHDLEKGAISQRDHEILRGLLGEAGYECVYSRRAQKTRRYPLSDRNFYARPGEGHIDVFVEYDLSEGKNPNGVFSHLRLRMSEYANFVEDYNRLITADKYAILGVGGMLMALSGFVKYSTTLGLSMIILGGGSVLLALYLDIMGTRKSQKRIKSLRPETNSQIAIQKAFGLSKQEQT